jgi:trehalose synthase
MLQVVKTKPKRLKDYKGIISDELYAEILELAAELKGLRVLQINATKLGGGVAEILHSFISLLNDVGIKAEWQLIEGDNRLYDITKSFHNAFQGKDYELSEKTKRIYERFNAYNAHILEGEWDIMMIHDPQPAALPYYLADEKTKYVWRCHIDTSHPHPDMWNFFQPFLSCYDAAIFTMARFAPKNFPAKKIYYIPPAIDPLVTKNVEMDAKKADKILRKYRVDPDKPIMTQVSRFDPWKDPIGVIEAYRIAKKVFPDLQLIMVGQMATDDPEGVKIFEKVKKFAASEKGIFLLVNLPDNDVAINAIQTSSDIMIQKSIREGFGLTVTEPMWKGKPMVAGNCGGIRIQIKNGKNGFLVDSVEESAKRVVELLENPEKAAELGKNAKESVREHYLLPRLLRDELLVYKEVLLKTKKKEKVLSRAK